MVEPKTPAFDVPMPREVHLAARLRGRFVHLQAAALDDYAALYQMSTDAETLLRWRHRGSVPPPEQFPQVLGQGTFTQFLIIGNQDGARVGLVQAYNVDFRNQCVSIAMLIDPAYEGAGWSFEGGALFLQYLFENWAFRKIYVESLEFNVHRFFSGALSGLFEIEGCLKNHEYQSGEYWHMYFLAVYREAWAEFAPRLLPPEVLRSQRGGDTD